MFKCTIGLMLTLLALLTACASAGDDSLSTENAALSTQISEIRSTATYESDRLQITIEYIQTAITQVAEQNQEIAVTLAAAGYDPTQLARITPEALPFATATQRPTVIVPQTTDEAGGIVGNNELLTPTAGAPSLYNIVMAQGVGDNDCALSAMTSFPATTEQIYVVATAANIAPGTTLGASWLNEGQAAVSQDFTPDFSIDQNCIWFYIDQTDTIFTPGNWSVQLTINGQPAGAPVNFTITE